jgi:hypothetical protein
MKKHLLFFVLISFLMSSCVRREEYVATVKVVNHSSSAVENFVLKADAEEKTIQILEPDEEFEFKIAWIGRSAAFLASMDNSYLHLEISYTINEKQFDIADEAGAIQDSYGNYYSEKTITDGSAVSIIIGDDGYEIKDFQAGLP